MLAMLLWAAGLRQITGAIGSQIRMEIYAKLGDKMVTYYYVQKVAGNVANDIEFTDVDYKASDPSKRKAVSHKVKILGETKNYPRVTGRDDVKFLTGGKATASCKLTFLKSIKKSVFLASIGTSAGQLVTFEFGGSLERAMYDKPITGVLAMIPGKWAHLIDL